jgi:hypothetical protein
MLPHSTQQRRLTKFQLALGGDVSRSTETAAR